jgi:hypothetical protein
MLLEFLLVITDAFLTEVSKLLGSYELFSLFGAACLGKEDLSNGLSCTGIIMSTVKSLGIFTPTISIKMCLASWEPSKLLCGPKASGSERKCISLTATSW